jgi:thiol-disulfide isomerase/thioredoxin
MDPADALELLVEAVIVEEEDGVLGLSASYRSRLETHLSELRDCPVDDRREAVAEQRGDEEADRLLDLTEGDVEPVAQYLALTESLDRGKFEERLRLVPTLQQLCRPALDRSAPEGFTPVHPEQLPFLLNLYERAIVYVWRDDCPPCETMREEFGSLFPEPDEQLALLSVYGPDGPQLLRKRYSVTAGPTTLFVIDGEVDSRLLGSQYRSVIESEIETLRTL